MVTLVHFDEPAIHLMQVLCQFPDVILQFQCFVFNKVAQQH